MITKLWVPFLALFLVFGVTNSTPHGQSTVGFSIYPGENQADHHQTQHSQAFQDKVVVHYDVRHPANPNPTEPAWKQYRVQNSRSADWTQQNQNHQAHAQWPTDRQQFQRQAQWPSQSNQQQNWPQQNTQPQPQWPSQHNQPQQQNNWPSQHNQPQQHHWPSQSNTQNQHQIQQQQQHTWPSQHQHFQHQPENRRELKWPTQAPRQHQHQPSQHNFQQPRQQEQHIQARNDFNGVDIGNRPELFDDVRESSLRRWNEQKDSLGAPQTRHQRQGSFHQQLQRRGHQAVTVSVPDLQAALEEALDESAPLVYY